MSEGVYHDDADNVATFLDDQRDRLRRELQRTVNPGLQGPLRARLATVDAILAWCKGERLAGDEFVEYLRNIVHGVTKVEAPHLGLALEEAMELLQQWVEWAELGPGQI